MCRRRQRFLHADSFGLNAEPKSAGGKSFLSGDGGSGRATKEKACYSICTTRTFYMNWVISERTSLQDGSYIHTKPSQQTFRPPNRTGLTRRSVQSCDVRYWALVQVYWYYGDQGYSICLRQRAIDNFDSRRILHCCDFREYYIASQYTHWSAAMPLPKMVSSDDLLATQSRYHSFG